MFSGNKLISSGRLVMNFSTGCRMNGFTQNRGAGIMFAVCAGILWGFVPIYIHFLGEVSPLEIVAHRSFWSLVMLFGLIMFRHQMGLAWQIFCNKKLLAGLSSQPFYSRQIGQSTFMLCNLGNSSARLLAILFTQYARFYLVW